MRIGEEWWSGVLWSRKDKGGISFGVSLIPFLDLPIAFFPDPFGYLSVLSCNRTQWIKKSCCWRHVTVRARSQHQPSTAQASGIIVFDAFSHRASYKQVCVVGSSHAWEDQRQPPIQSWSQSAHSIEFMIVDREAYLLAYHQCWRILQFIIPSTISTGATGSTAYWFLLLSSPTVAE